MLLLEKKKKMKIILIDVNVNTRMKLLTIIIIIMNFSFDPCHKMRFTMIHLDIFLAIFEVRPSNYSVNKKFNYLLLFETAVST